MASGRMKLVDLRPRPPELLEAICHATRRWRKACVRKCERKEMDPLQFLRVLRVNRTRRLHVFIRLVQ